MPIICPDAPVSLVIYYEDHGVPHFHVLCPDGRSPEYAAQVTISAQAVILSGKIPRKYRREILEWAVREEVALLANWARAQAPAGLPLLPIPWKAR